MVVLYIGYFILYLSYVWVILSLYFRYIRICIHMFVNVIYMFTVVCWCTSCDLILGCTLSWESYHAYFLYMICYAIVAILIDLNSQKCINVSLFELVVTCIETDISVSSFSISLGFISIIKWLCCFLILGKLFNLNIQHSKKYNQHHLYIIFEKIPRFPCCGFVHTRIQCVTLKNKGRCFIFHSSGQEDIWIGVGYRNRGLKSLLLSFCARPFMYWWKMQCAFTRMVY